MSSYNNCLEFRFSIVRIVISVSSVTNLWDCLCHCVSLCLFVGQVRSPHHSDQISQMSQVSRIALWRCSLNVFVFVIVFVFVFVFVIVFFWSLHVSPSLQSNASKIPSIWDRSLKVFSRCICLCHCLCLCLCHCLCHCLFFGQVMSPYRPEQISLRTQVSRIDLWRCSLNVFVFVIVFLLVRSCPLITLIKCLKGHKFLGLLSEMVL